MTVKASRWHLLQTIVVLLSMVGTLPGQVSRGTILGTVVDQSGGVVSNA